MEPWRPLLNAEQFLTDDQLKAVGCLAFEASRLEQFIDMLIQDLCHFDENQMKVFVGRLTIEPKATILRDLLWPLIEGSAIEKEFSEIYGDIKDLIAKRNTAIHGEWADKDEREKTEPQKLADLLRMVRRDSSVAKKRWGAVTVKADEVMDLVRRFAQRETDLILWYGQKFLPHQKQQGLDALNASLDKPVT